MSEHLSIVAQWARQKLREGANSPAAGAHLQQLIAAAENLRADMAAAPARSGNVIALDDYRRNAQRMM